MYLNPSRNVVDHRDNPPKSLIAKMMHNVRNDSALMPAYCAIADRAAGKRPDYKEMISIIETALTARYTKTVAGGGEQTAKGYVCSFIDPLVECLFPDEEMWPDAKEALREKFAPVGETTDEPALRA